MEVTVVNNSKAPSRIHLGEGVGVIKLKPGANLVDFDMWSQADKLPVVRHMIETDRLVLKDPPAANKKWKKGQVVRDLSDFDVVSALAAIEAEDKVTTLRKWGYQDAREDIQKALYARADKLNPLVEKPKNAE